MPNKSPVSWVSNNKSSASSPMGGLNYYDPKTSKVFRGKLNNSSGNQPGVEWYANNNATLSSAMGGLNYYNPKNYTVYRGRTVKNMSGAPRIIPRPPLSSAALGGDEVYNAVTGNVIKYYNRGGRRTKVRSTRRR
jgi:hypothetical protein